MIVLRLFAVFLLLAASTAWSADLPNPTLTPGKVMERRAEVVCVPGYAGKVRDVSNAKKREVYRRYGLPYNDRSECAEGAEVDHLVSLQLGGSNEVENLFPQSYCGTWNAHVKDRYENYLHEQVCKGKMKLKAAQKEISTDWIKGYLSHPELPVPGEQ